MLGRRGAIGKQHQLFQQERRLRLWYERGTGQPAARRPNCPYRRANAGADVALAGREG